MLYLMSAIYLAAVTFISVVANTLVLVAFFKEKKLRTPINMVLINLSFSDLGIATVGTTISFVNSIERKWAFSQEVCHFYALVSALCGISSITTLAVLAFWRSMMITSPMCRKWSLSRRRSNTLILFIWCYSTCVTMPPLLGWGKFGEEFGGISCSVDWRDESLLSKTYIMYIFFFGLILPLLAIIMAYSKIIGAVKKKTKTNRTKLQSRLTIMIGIMVITFLFSWTPYAIVSLLEAFGDKSNLQLHPSFVTIPSLFAKSSVIFNPLVYAGLNTQFQKVWRRIFHLPIKNQNALSKEEITDNSIPRSEQESDGRSFKADFQSKVAINLEGSQQEPEDFVELEPFWQDHKTVLIYSNDTVIVLKQGSNTSSKSFEAQV
ncbi:pinopsin-like [Artemia franciscana]